MLTTFKILLIAIPLISSNISTVQLARATSTTYFFPAMLSFSTYCVTTIRFKVSFCSGIIYVSNPSAVILVLIFRSTTYIKFTFKQSYVSLINKPATKSFSVIFSSLLNNSSVLYAINRPSKLSFEGQFKKVILRKIPLIKSSFILTKLSYLLQHLMLNCFNLAWGRVYNLWNYSQRWLNRACRSIIAIFPFSVHKAFWKSNRLTTLVWVLQLLLVAVILTLIYLFISLSLHSLMSTLDVIYLDIDWVNTEICLLSIPPLVTTTFSTKTLHVITGNLLGDGSLLRTGKKVDGQRGGNARFEMNKCTQSLDQHLETFRDHYKEFSGVGFRKNTYFSGSLLKVFTQFHIFTKSLPAFTELHSLWYVWDPVLLKYIKIVPLEIELMFSRVSIAYWIMDDGYYTDKTVILCTDNFTMPDCIRLQELLSTYGVLSGIITQKGKYRIRIFRTSMPTLIELVLPYIHKDFLYKLGL